MGCSNCDDIDSYYQGKESGIEEGKNQGYKLGYEAGRLQGRVEGRNDGMRDAGWEFDVTDMHWKYTGKVDVMLLHQKFLWEIDDNVSIDVINLHVENCKCC